MKPATKIIKGTNGLYGVETDEGSVMYECDFSKEVARRIVQLENSKEPPEDWMETLAILECEGYKV